jgi:site-specific DNA-methyltransferase (adenine-specific)
MSHKRKSTIQTPKDEWSTPDEIFVPLSKEFNFTLDAAATAKNTKCPTYFTKEMDALSLNWNEYNKGGDMWLNPPFSRGNIERFMQKAYTEGQKNKDYSVVCIVPVDFSTQWWHKYVMQAAEIRVPEGRVKYVGYDDQEKRIRNSPTFSSCIVVFNKERLHTSWGEPFVWMKEF